MVKRITRFKIHVAILLLFTISITVISYQPLFDTTKNEAGTAL